jgi:hypothetical protein
MLNKERLEFLRKKAAGISALSLREQMILIVMIFDNLNDKYKMKWYEKISGLVFPARRWLEIEQWMEKRFMKNISRTPWVVASMCMNCMKIKDTMKHKMIILAQKVKARVVMREKRKGFEK